MALSLDFETRSPVDLKKHGAYVYFSHSLTDVMIASYSINDGPVRRWRWTEPCPSDVRKEIESGQLFIGHNCAFERLAINHVLAPRHGWPTLGIKQTRCTAAMAAAMGLPRALGDLGKALGLPVQKDDEGYRLMLRMSKPRMARKGEDPTAIHWYGWDDPALVDRLHTYCDDDVRTEEAARKRMVPLSPEEQEVYWLSEIINDRGIRIDRTSAIAALDLAEKTKARLDREMIEATGGYVKACSQVAALTSWVQGRGVAMTSAAKADIEALLECDDLPPDVRRAVELRQEAAKTSVAKLRAMLDRASSDGRVRGTGLYHGAGTGRWSNVGVNFSNMPRPRRVFEETAPPARELFAAIRTADPDHLIATYGPQLGRPLHLLSDAIRGFVWAAPGHDFVQADYSSIEGVVIAWLAREEWKLQAFREINADPKNTPDMYRRTAAAIMGMSTDVITKKHPLRQSVGKVSELACFGPDTRVLTNNGVKRIKEVSSEDRLWDGVEWIGHNGLVERSARPVVVVDGIEVTPGHLIMTGQRWTPARQLVSDPDCLAQALATGSESLLSLASPKAPRKDFDLSSSAVPADDRRMRSPSATFARVRARAAEFVREMRRRRAANGTWLTMMSFRTKIIAGGFLTESLLASTVAATRTTRAGRTTGDAGSRSFGGKIAERFSRTLSPSTGGPMKASSLIESTSTKITSREICDSLRARSMRETVESIVTCNTESKAWSEKSHICAAVYDIAHAGPRNRFTILSDSGALLVHNCGFGGGVAAFAAMARAYTVDLNQVHASVWEAASPERRDRALRRYEGACSRKERTTEVLSDKAWVACEIVKVGWREQNAQIRKMWSDLEDAMRAAVREPGSIHEAGRVKYKVAMGFLWAQLPSGRCLAYGGPRLKDQVWVSRKIDGNFADAEVMDREAAERLAARGEARIDGPTSPKVTALGVNSVTKRWERFALYGGLAAENNTQATARDWLVNGLKHTEAAGYPTVTTVYDEALAEVPRGFGSVEEFERLLCTPPAWGLDIPIVASGWRGKRYRKD